MLTFSHICQFRIFIDIWKDPLFMIKLDVWLQIWIVSQISSIFSSQFLELEAQSKSDGEMNIGQKNSPFRSAPEFIISDIHENWMNQNLSQLE